jgi:predicted nucleotidyltransferase
MSMRKKLTEMRGAILVVAARLGASNVRVFGSVARGEEAADSDIDFLVALERGRTLLDLVSLEEELTALIGRKVDVVVEGGLSPHIGPAILREAVGL